MEDESERWSRDYNEAYSRGDQETMDRMNADNEAEERQLDPSVPDQRLIDMANAAYGWGSDLAYMDHYDTIFEEHTSDLEGDAYWDAVHSAESLHNKIWQAGMAALGLKTTGDIEYEADSAAAMRSAKIGNDTASFDDLMADRDQAISDGKDLREHYRSYLV